MKKFILSAALTAIAGAANSQTVIADSVYIGAGYASNVWYSLANDSVTSQPKNNWDLAFETSQFGVGILLNTANGDRLWSYPKSDTAGFNTVDTAGLSTWATRYNSDTSWFFGAFNQGSNNFDIGWGQYDINTHIITGDSIFIVRIGNAGPNAMWKKLIITDMSAGAYHFRYANLNGSNAMTMTGTKSGYSTKNLFYFNMTTNAFVDREPAANTWDLWFGQYNDVMQLALGNPSPVTGILTNAGVQVAKAYPLADAATYIDYSAQSFGLEINRIGFNWKTFGGTGYTIEDSTAFFVKTRDGAIWKMIMTGFGGNGDGKMAFTKQKLISASVPVINGNSVATVAVYPNPAQGQNTNLVYSFDQTMSNASVIVTDMSGRSAFAAQLDGTIGLHQLQLPTGSLSSGLYTVTVNTAAGRVQQKLVVRN